MKLHYASDGYAIATDDPSTQPRYRYSVTRDEAEILAAMAREKRVLEVGTGLGVATRAMATTARNVVTVDVDRWVLESVPLSPDVELREDIPDDGRVFDLIFIDGDHTRDAVIKDIERAMPVLAPGGRIVFHDYTHRSHPGVAEACLRLGLAERITVVKTANGLGVYEETECDG